MLHFTRRAIIRWAGVALLTAASGYVGTCFALGKRTEWSPLGEKCTFVEFHSPSVAIVFLPLAMIESNVRHPIVDVWCDTGQLGIVWECERLCSPRKVILPAGVLATLKSALQSSNLQAARDEMEFN